MRGFIFISKLITFGASPTAMLHWDCVGFYFHFPTNCVLCETEINCSVHVMLHGHFWGDLLRSWRFLLQVLNKWVLEWVRCYENVLNQEKALRNQTKKILEKLLSWNYMARKKYPESKRARGTVPFAMLWAARMCYITRNSWIQIAYLCSNIFVSSVHLHLHPRKLQVEGYFHTLFFIGFLT